MQLNWRFGEGKRLMRNAESDVRVRSEHSGGCRTGSGARLLQAVALVPLLASCVHGTVSPPRFVSPSSGEVRQSTAGLQASDESAVYRRMGLLVSDGELPFVGRISFLGGPSPESTTVLVTASVPASAMTFARQASRRHAGRLQVSAELLRGGEEVHSFSTDLIVQVGSYRESTRPDASVLHQEIFHVAPGDYELSLSIRDAGSTRSGIVRSSIHVPRLGDGAISNPMPVLRAEARDSPAAIPRVIVDPRGTYVFGRDTVVRIYLESYMTDSVSLELSAQELRGSGTPGGEADGERALWRDTLFLAPPSDSIPLAVGTFEVPVTRLPIGLTEFVLSRSDSAAMVEMRVPVAVVFGPGLPVTSFDEMVSQLRWFAGASRLAALREAAPEQRSSVWREFLRDTDPDPGTVEHEGLQRYFERISIADERFRGEAVRGWLSDRGRVFVALGEPDMIHDGGGQAFSERGRQIVWEYRRFNLRLVFQDPTGFDGWRLAPGMEEDFRAALSRRHGT